MRLGHKKVPTSAQREVRITNKLGLHARPAAQFVKRVTELSIGNLGSEGRQAIFRLQPH